MKILASLVVLQNKLNSIDSTDNDQWDAIHNLESGMEEMPSPGDIPSYDDIKGDIKEYRASTNGYILFTNNLIIEWGLASITDIARHETTAHIASFPKVCNVFALTVSPEVKGIPDGYDPNYGETIVRLTNITNSGFSAYVAFIEDNWAKKDGRHTIMCHWHVTGLCI